MPRYHQLLPDRRPRTSTPDPSRHVARGWPSLTKKWLVTVQVKPNIAPRAGHKTWPVIATKTFFTHRRAGEYADEWADNHVLRTVVSRLP